MASALTPLLDLVVSDPLLFLPIPFIASIFVFAAFREKRMKARILSGEDPRARLKVYRGIMIQLWGLAAIVTASWLASGRSLEALGFAAPGGVGYWIGWAIAIAGLSYLVYSLIQAALSADARRSLRRQVNDAGDLVLIRPETPAEHRRFQLVSITAGVTEEVIFRGYMITLAALFMPVWAAAILATALFILAHAYQGVTGMMRIAPISIALAAIFVISGSLWPVIVLHIAVDAIGGGLFAITDRFREADATAETGEAQPA